MTFKRVATVFGDPLILSQPDDEHSGYEERWASIGVETMKTEYDFSKAERGRFFRRSTDRRLPARPDQARHWAGPDGQLSRFVRKKTDGALRAYREKPERVTGDANQEIAITDEQCRHRQVFELIQNCADSLMPRVDGGGSVLVRLTRGFLYCADNGRPLDRDSVTAMMSCHVSRERSDEEFGRFRIGFKSVLEPKISDSDLEGRKKSS